MARRIASNIEFMVRAQQKKLKPAEFPSVSIIFMYNIYIMYIIAAAASCRGCRLLPTAQLGSGELS